MRIIYLFCLTALLSSCGEELKTATKEVDASIQEDVPVEKEDLVEIKGDTYIEYYPDGKSVKFTGPQDSEGRRNGKWVYLSETGAELSMTMYKNGQKHGHSIVKYPDGTIHYHGEYKEDQKVGVWKTYNERGKLTTESTHEFRSTEE